MEEKPSHGIPARPLKALVAVEHAMLTAAWHMLTTGEFYKDPGDEFFLRRTPARTRARALGQLESLGYQVTLESAPSAANTPPTSCLSCRGAVNGTGQVLGAAFGRQSDSSPKIF